MRRQAGHPAEVQPTVAEHLEQDRVLPGRLGHGDAQVYVRELPDEVRLPDGLGQKEVRVINSGTDRRNWRAGTLSAALVGRAQGLLTRAASRPIISTIDTSTMDSPRTPGSFLPLPDADLEILVALADGEAHGYAIMRAVDERTEGRRRLGPGTLYTALKRLLAARLIEEVGASRDAGGEEARRRLYRLSHFGSRVLGAELDRLSTLVRHGRKRLQLLPSGGRS